MEGTLKINGIDNPVILALNLAALLEQNGVKIKLAENGRPVTVKIQRPRIVTFPKDLELTIEV